MIAHFNAVVITGDMGMPQDDAALLARHGVTLALLDLARRPPRYLAQDWPWELVHRWAHVLEDQAAGTSLVYGATSDRPWTPKRRRPPTISAPSPAGRTATPPEEPPAAPSDSAYVQEDLPGIAPKA